MEGEDGGDEGEGLAQATVCATSADEEEGGSPEGKRAKRGVMSDRQDAFWGKVRSGPVGCVYGGMTLLLWLWQRRYSTSFAGNLRAVFMLVGGTICEQ